MNQKIFVCFLRGINVSGKNMITMDTLKDLFIKSGFIEITTYLQSGNVIFKSPVPYTTDRIRKKIEKRIQNDLNLRIPVLIRTGESVIELSGRNTFLFSAMSNPEKLHVTMLGKIPEVEKINSLLMNDFSPEEYFISGCDIFLYCPDGYGRAKLNNNFFERKLEVFATTRNWKTITNIQALIKNQYSIEC